MTQASNPNERQQQSKDTAGTPAYRDVAKLRAAYEASDGSVKGASERFDASYYAVRDWLIEYGIHVPQEREEMSLAAQLEDPDVREFEDLEVSG